MNYFMNMNLLLQVHFILSGEQDETDVRALNDTKRKVLQRGNVDVFAMTCSRLVLTFLQLICSEISGLQRTDES